MEQLTQDYLRLVIDAARQHYRDDQHWRPVHGPAYFESNLKKARNKIQLGEAINNLDDFLQKFKDTAFTKKYQITSGRWDVPMSIYKKFETKSDEEAKNIFKEITERKENAWETMFLYRIDQTEKTTVLAAVRVRDSEGYANDL